MFQTPNKTRTEGARVLAIAVPATNPAVQVELLKKALEIAKELPSDPREALVILAVLSRAYGLFLADCGAI